MDIVDNAIERGVGDRRISDVGVPALDREHDGRALVAADPEIMALLGAEREWSATSAQLPSFSGNFTLAPPSATRV